MKKIRMVLAVMSLSGLCVFSGCAVNQNVKADRKSDFAKVMEGYAPQSVDIIGLSELKENIQTGQVRLKLFVMLLDQFGSSVKYPGTFRFEIFEYVARSPVPHGKRIESWQDIDAVYAAANNALYRDYLKAYQFDLDLKNQLVANKTYIVAVTFISSKGKRIGNQAKIRYLQ